MPPHGSPRILPCPGLTVTVNAGVTFIDSLRRVHDLANERTLSPKEAASDARLGGMSAKTVLRLIRRGEIYPILRRNRRVFLVFDCALTDWRLRAAQPTTHLIEQRLSRVA